MSKSVKASADDVLKAVQAINTQCASGSAANDACPMLVVIKLDSHGSASVPLMDCSSK
jgi:hypothetical protein